jgi:hypothetical protein
VQLNNSTAAGGQHSRGDTQSALWLGRCYSCNMASILLPHHAHLTSWVTCCSIAVV